MTSSLLYPILRYKMCCIVAQGTTEITLQWLFHGTWFCKGERIICAAGMKFYLFILTVAQIVLTGFFGSVANGSGVRVTHLVLDYICLLQIWWPNWSSSNYDINLAMKDASDGIGSPFRIIFLKTCFQHKQTIELMPCYNVT